MNNNIIIELNDIEKKFTSRKKEVKVLSNINLQIEKGEMVAIVGPSGAGKSTLLNIIGLLEVPTKGNYFLEGIDTKIKDKDKAMLRGEKFGFIIQDFSLIEKYTVKENIMIPFEYNGKYRYTKSEKEELIKVELEKLGINDKIEEYAYNLSGGQRQRVAVARALIKKPDIILADEPTGSLDSETAKELLIEFKNLQKRGITIIIVTHDDKVAQLANRIIKIDKGSIVHSKKGTPLNNM